MRRRRSRKKRSKLLYGVIAATFIFLCLVIYSYSHPTNHVQHPQTPIPQPSLPKAAIVDHLSISQPNQTFVQTATTILNKTGFIVDYHKGENVTVDFYRNLPSHGYGLIILRVHSAIIEDTDSVSLFTSELYKEDKAATTYFWEIMDDRLVRVFFTEGSPKYFGISPKFVEFSMNGRFENTTIIMMGCDGLTPGYTTLAKAFVKRGAKVYIGWSGPVTSAHSDRATIYLLQFLTVEKQTIKSAIISTMNEVGADPALHTQLLYYPTEEENYIVPVSFSKHKQQLFTIELFLSSLRPACCHLRTTSVTTIKNPDCALGCLEIGL